MSECKLPRHPITGLRAVGFRKDGRAIWPILGAEDSPQNPVLDAVLKQRDDQVAFVDRTVAAASKDKRDLSESELELVEKAQQRCVALDEQINKLTAFEKIRRSSQVEEARVLAARTVPDEDDDADEGDGTQQRSAGGRSLGGGRTNPRPHEYRSAGEFMVDYTRAKGYHESNGQPDADAAERVRSAMGTQTRIATQTTTETPALLPKPIVGQILNDLDEARPFVSSIGVLPMEGIPGKTFTRPKVTQHTTSGAQPGEKQELPSRQYKVDGVDFTKTTRGGTLNISRQDIDWTSPSAWDAIITDLQQEYAADTDDTAAAAFATAITQTVQVKDPEGLDNYITALYQGAAKVVTANKTVRGTALRMPNAIWTSIDMWATVGALMDRLRMVNSSGQAGATSATDFAGTILDVDRTVVPGLPDGTVILGRKQKTEFYEQRIGLLSVVEPRIFGVEVAYGGYIAFGTLDVTNFTKLVTGTDTP